MIDVTVVAHNGHLYALTVDGIYDIATYEGKTA
jgi:hypothetical protein